MTMNEIFSTNLRNLLYARNKSQVELAKALGVSETSVSFWVNGTTVPRHKTIDKICQFLRCTRDDLLVDHTQIAEVAPEDVMADELRERPKLFKLMLYASRLSDAELDDLIARAKK